MQYSIVPNLLRERKIRFFDENEVKIIFELSGTLPKFNPPFLNIDTFAKKTTSPEDIINLTLEQLKKIGYLVVSIKTRNGWFRGQRARYLIESKTNRSRTSKTFKFLPREHQIQFDRNNKRIRLQGSNSGQEGTTNWINLEEKDDKK